MRCESSAAILCIAALAPVLCAQTGSTRDLDAGRALLQQLDQTSDPIAVFNRVGEDRASTLLLAVGQHGMQRSASPEDWAEMHKAYSALIELESGRGNFFKAAIWAQLQAAAYRSLEEDSAQALVFSKRSLELQRKSGVTATIYTRHLDIASDLIALGQYPAAIAELREAQRTNPDGHSVLAAQIERKLIQAELKGSQAAAAREELQAFLTHAAGTAPQFQAEALLAKADVLLDSGNFNNAVDAMKAAWPLGSSDQAFTWEVTNLVLRCVLDSIRSLSYGDAIALAKRIGDSFPKLPISVVGLAHQAIQSRRRLAGDVDALLREHFAELEAARRSGSAAAQAQVLCSLAVTYQSMNDHDDRVTVLREAVGLVRPQHAVTADDGGAARQFFLALRMLGDAYVDDGDLDSARKSFEAVTAGIDGVQVAAIKATLKDLYADAILGQARVDTAAGEIASGRRLLEQAEQGGLPSGAFDRLFLHLERARLEKAAGNRDEAVRQYNMAIEAASAEHESMWEVAVRLELAQYTASGPAGTDVSTLPKQVSEIQARANALGFNDAAWRVSFITGLAAESAGDAAHAIESYRAAVDQLDQVRAGVTLQQGRTTIVGTTSADELYTRLIGLLTDAGQKELAWEYVERRKARTFLEMLHGRKFRTSGANPQLADMQTLQKQILDLQWQTAPESVALTRASGQDVVMLRRQLHALQAKFMVARQQAALRKSRSGQNFSLKPLSLAEVQAKLPSDAALLEYALAGDRVIAFVVTHERAVEGVWKMDAQQLRAEVQVAREALAEPASNGGEALQAVSAALLQPVVPALPASISKLIVVPADYLNYVPFQALPIGNGQFAIDRFAISYLPNATSLAFLGNGRLRKDDSLFLGAIGTVSAGAMPPLPGTLKEVESIAESRPAADMAEGNQFTYSRLRKALATDTEVHMATHGVLNSASPLFNAVLTAPAAHGPSRLSLYELTDMNIRARLIVLSACQTALGKISSGDEVTGLSRMFLQAGANTVVASLWSVSDASTALLMRGFYHELSVGKQPAEALRLSALQVRKSYPAPYYWAPFVVNGAD